MNNTNQPANPFFSAQDERDRRWRLILGKTEEAEQQPGDNGEGEDGEDGDTGQGPADQSGQGDLSEQDQALDDALESLYGDGDEGGDSNSSPEVARWLGDINSYFPEQVATLMQKDALKKLKIREILKDEQLLEQLQPDIELATQLLSLSKVLPAETKETARQVVREVVEDLRKQLEYPLQQAIRGTLQKATRTNRPKLNEIDWHRTIHANLKHYQPDQKTIIPERVIGYGRQNESLHDVILCIDQSGSMKQSVVYASIFGAVMASLPALNTRLVVFSTQFVDLTDKLSDPVDALFGVQLRGGTNIAKALAYCHQQVTRPEQTLLVLITDLFEGNKDKQQLVNRVAKLTAEGVQVVVLLALSDKGTPRFNREISAELVTLGVPAFACTPALFPDMMGAALAKRDIAQWAASNGIVTAPLN